MDSELPAQAVVLDSALCSLSRICGTGGWLPPEQRQAADWLTLIKLCGWRPVISRVENDPAPELGSDALRWIVIADAPERLGEAAAQRLEVLAREKAVLIIGRAARADSPYARISGVSRTGGVKIIPAIGWCGPGQEEAWACRRGFEGYDVSADDLIETWAVGAGGPLVVARRCGRGAIATLAFDPSAARDIDGAATALLRHMLIFGSQAPVAWFDWSGTMVLRMDDPGGAQNVHSRSWRYPKLAARDWSAMGDELAARNGRLGIAYVPGWVDDGNPARGGVTVGGTAVLRVPGAVYPSSLVSYVDASGEQPCASSDYRDEHAGIQALRGRGLAEVELHGYTHINPDRSAWLRAQERYDSNAWYRELGASASATIAQAGPDQHPLTLGAASLCRQFGVAPTTLVCPGDEWTDQALEHALTLGIRLVSSYYLALRHDDRLYWSTHVCAPYLDEPDPAWLDAGLPVVGYFHDREPALMGTAWFAECLERWSAAGVVRWIDFRELASAACRTLYVSGDGLRLHVHEVDAPALVRPLHVRVYIPEELAGAAGACSAAGCCEVQMRRLGPTRAKALLEAVG